MYPTLDQTQLLTVVLTTCRYLYNEVLEDRKNAYDRCGVGLSYTQQAGQLKYLNLAIHSQVAQDVLRRLDKAFRNFFGRVKNGAKKAGYPRFQGKNRYDSFTYPQSGFKIKDGKLHLSKIGAIRIFQHRVIEGKIKTCTIKQEGDQWYVCLSVELPDAEKKELKTSVGIDVGITTLATLSDGVQIENPKILDKYGAKLQKAQKYLSRKQKGSNNWKKQKLKVARIHRKIRNVRKDYMHKASRILADTYDRIVFGDLQIKNDFFTKNRVKAALRVGLAIYFFVNEKPSSCKINS